jgi:protein-tyrosine phosphatase
LFALLLRVDLHILFVCTGNTCRSPTAEGLLRHALEARGVGGQVTVASAGTGAWDGAPASEGAYLVGIEQGVDLSSHRARLLTRELVASADVILVMSRHHAVRVAELGGADRVHLLPEYAGKAGEVTDPFGGELEDYRTTFSELRELVDAVVTRLAAESLGDQR